MTDVHPLEADLQTHWRRLDRRMLLVHPVHEVIRFLPFLVGVFFLGSSTEDGGWWHFAGVVVPVALGLLRYATTRFQITADQVELRHGLLNKHRIATRIDRVRTVDLTSTPIHRMLGLAKVEIGTGTSSRKRSERLVLDALEVVDARRLRVELLHWQAERADGQPQPAPSATAAPGALAARASTAAAPERTLVRLDPSWVRYAPLTTSGAVVVLGALAFVGQFVSRVAAREGSQFSRAAHQVQQLPIAVTVVLALVSALVVISVLAVIGYALTSWGFSVTEDAASGSLHLRRGLLTTRETTIDGARVRGLEIGEPLGLRLAGGGRLGAIVTGLDRRERARTPLVPPAPRAVVEAVGDQVLGERGIFTAPLVRHGAAARRRRYTRAVTPAVVLFALSLWLAWWRHAPWPPVAGLLVVAGSFLLAKDRYAGLGHALTPRYLVVRSGCFSRRRDVLAREGIIGWNLRQSWFQRRAGVLTLTATTAGGKQGYRALDVPEAEAVRVAAEAAPGLVRQFLL